MDSEKEVESIKNTDCQPLCAKRRSFLVASAGNAVAASLYSSATAAGENTGETAAASYPRLKITTLGNLVEGEGLAFNYPLNEQPNMLVKLGRRAQGGVGVDQDIVAYSVLCPHMGGSLRGSYQHEHGAMGPCPFHFSVFDLARGGVPVHASATQNLPQVTLEIDGDEIYAVGMTGLVYGFRDNLADGSLPDNSEVIGIKAVPGETQRG